MCPSMRTAIMRKAIIFSTLGALIIIYFFPGLVRRGSPWNHERIQMGMTDAQVHSILGAPRYVSESGTGQVRWEEWRELGIRVGVLFDANGKVVSKASVLVENDVEAQDDSKLTEFLRSWGILPERVRE
jgi:hypothetical protein